MVGETEAQKGKGFTQSYRTGVCRIGLEPYLLSSSTALVSSCLSPTTQLIKVKYTSSKKLMMRMLFPFSGKVSDIITEDRTNPVRGPSPS